MTLSTIREELNSAKWSIGQAMKELAKYDRYNESGRAYVVAAAKHDLEICFQRIHRALLIDEGKTVEVPR